MSRQLLVCCLRKRGWAAGLQLEVYILHFSLSLLVEDLLEGCIHHHVQRLVVGGSLEEHTLLFQRLMEEDSSVV